MVYAKGVEAQGKLTVTHGITQYTRVRLFSAVGNKCDLLARFSTVADDIGRLGPRSVRLFAQV